MSRTRKQCLVSAVAVLIGGAARAEPPSATLEVRVTVPSTPGTATGVVQVRSDGGRAFESKLSLRDGAGTATFAELTPGPATVSVTVPGLAMATGDLETRAGEHISMAAALVPALSGPSRIRVVDRQRVAAGTAFDEHDLRDLPSDHRPPSLLETVETSAIADRLSGGGLFVGEPTPIGARGSSWTQTSYTLGDIDITDPESGGTPLMVPELGSLRGIHVSTGMMPAQLGPPGVTVHLSPRRPSPRWSGSARMSLVPTSLSSTAPPSRPYLARFESFVDGALDLGGPVVPGRVAARWSASLTRLRRSERNDPAELTSRVASGSAHILVTPTPNDEIRLLLAGQDVRGPSSDRVRFDPPAPEQHDDVLHLQMVWDRRAPAGHIWSVGGGYQRATTDPSLPSGSHARVVDRLHDGPVPELLSVAPSTRERWDILGRLGFPQTQGQQIRHGPVLGVALSGAEVTIPPSGPTPATPEAVQGLPARVWDYGYPGPESQRHLIDFATYVSDRVALGDRLTLDAGLRFEATRASARGASSRISWATLVPRLSGRVRLTDFGRLSLFGFAGRYRHRLPLRLVAFGDPSGPQGSVYRWLDRDGDGAYQPGERGPLIARVGPGSDNGTLATIDPQLKAPHTDELSVGLESQIAGGISVRVVGFYRRESDLIESVNVGVPLSSYTVTLVQSPDRDILPPDQHLLPIYARTAASFGQDRYLLTNPPGHKSFYRGVEVTVEKAVGRLRFLAAGTASKSVGAGGARGFRAGENDQGVVGELFDQPNADTFARGRLFFDRAYSVKVSASYEDTRDLHLGVVARYQDGQPFARLLLAPDLPQGPEAIRTGPSTLHRFSFTLTLDARVEQAFAMGKGRRLWLVSECFNLLGAQKEVEEDVVTGPQYRVPTAFQPPRTFRFGVRFDF